MSDITPVLRIITHDSYLMRIGDGDHSDQGLLASGTRVLDIAHDIGHFWETYRIVLVHGRIGTVHVESFVPADYSEY